MIEYSNLVYQEILSSTKKPLELKVLLRGSLCSPPGIDFRRFPGRIYLPLTTPLSNAEQLVQTFRISIPDVSLARRHMLWFLLFKGITVLEWFVLSYQLDLLLREGRIGSCACLAGVLQLSSETRKRSESWFSHLRPIHKILSSRVPKSDQKDNERRSLLDIVIQELKIPKKAMPISSLYSHTWETVRISRPKDPNRLGVGYKDKGNLPKGDRPEPEILWEELWKPNTNARLKEALDLWNKTLFN
jgi:hypothetical protein